MKKEKYTINVKAVFESMDLVEYYKNPDEIMDIDSLTMIQLILNLEQIFDFEFDLDELDFNNFKSFNNILNLIVDKEEKNEQKFN